MLQDCLVEIFPSVNFIASCPFCDSEIKTDDWLIPGMWTLAHFHCSQCRLNLLTDLPYGLGLTAPVFINTDSGATIRPNGPFWYRDLTEAQYQNKSQSKVELVVSTRRSRSKICLVNCLFPWWGDAISLLLRINQIELPEDVGLAVLIQDDLKPYVPDCVDQIWIVSGGSPTKSLWNDTLGDAIKVLANNYEKIYIPRILQPALLTEREIESYTGFKPFDRQRWIERLATEPRITFFCRHDRFWTKEKLTGSSDSRIAKFLPQSANKHLQGYRQQVSAKNSRQDQLRRVIALAESIKSEFPKLRFTVMGDGKAGGFPSWIEDLRSDQIDDCQRMQVASQSHIYIGVLGSHMTLPSALAGATINLVPNTYWRNVLTDILINTEDQREAMYLYRLVPANIEVQTLKEIVISMLCNYPYITYAMNRQYYHGLSYEESRELATVMRQRQAVINKISNPSIEYLIGP